MGSESRGSDAFSERRRMKRRSSQSSKEFQQSRACTALSPVPSAGKPTWKGIHKLEFGANPKKVNTGEWICSLACKKKNQVITFKDAQAVEKHIMREHPDPGYNKFVCLRDGCGKEKVSPQQVLDHMGQKEEKGGHSINTKIEKDENLRAVKSSTGGKFRFEK